MSSPRKNRSLSFAFVSALAFAAPLCVFGADASTGTINGRVFNPATGAYVSNAEVVIEGTDLNAVSTQGGNFTIYNAPVGPHKLRVNYTGYEARPVSITVEAGKTASCELDLSTGSETVVMSAFVVSGEKEGNSKALSEQRHSSSITSTVSSDVFGDVVEGNVGEFLKYIPGVDLEYVEADTRAPRDGDASPLALCAARARGGHSRLHELL